MQKICLMMIVKNESSVIRRCLQSIKHHIHYWVIADTGSTDGTQSLIRECLAEIPGELHERPWVDFAHNRNEVLAFAQGKGDYLMHIDADDEIVFADRFCMPTLKKDFYEILTIAGQINSRRVFLLKNMPGWKWEGVLHENLINFQAKAGAMISGATYIYHQQGCHSRESNRAMKDAAIFERALKTDPENSRYVFYLGQSYFYSEQWEPALKAYQKRVAMNGWDEERFLSQLRIGEIQEKLNYPSHILINSYGQAYQLRPSRIEPIFFIADHLLKKEHHFLSYTMAKSAETMPLSSDTVFVQRWMYEWGIKLLIARSSFYIGKYDESYNISRKLLANPSLPENIRQYLEESFPKICEKAKKEC